MIVDENIVVTIETSEFMGWLEKELRNQGLKLPEGAREIVFIPESETNEKPQRFAIPNGASISCKVEMIKRGYNIR